MSKAHPPARRHHWVPQGYLRLFADARGQVHVYRKGTGGSFPSNPLSIAQQHFYARKVERTLDMSVETFLAEHNDDAPAKVLPLIPTVLHHLPDRAHSLLPPLLNAFAARQLLRTPHIRRQLLIAAGREVGTPGVTMSKTRLSTEVHLQFLTQDTVPRMTAHFDTLHPPCWLVPETPSQASSHWGGPRLPLCHVMNQSDYIRRAKTTTLYP